MRRTSLIALSVTFPLLVGCGTGGSPLASTSEQDVRARSVTAGLAMSQAGRTSSAVEHARRVVGDVGVARIDLLEARGDGINGQVILRISASQPASGFSSGSTATACFRYQINDSSGGTEPHEVTCPHRDPITLPIPSPVPTLPADTEQRLRAALRSSHPEPAVRRAFGGTSVLVRTMTDGGVLGASVLAGRAECVFGRRLHDGQVQVWVVPSVLAQPGELGCDAHFAVTGDGMHPPH